MRAVVVVVVASLFACASTDTQARLDATRSRAHDGAAVADVDAIAYADAVAAGVKEGLADNGDVDDVVYVLRLRLAASEQQAPLLEAQGRLFLAAHRTAESEASFVAAAQAAPSLANAQALLAASRDRGDAVRVVALCGAGAGVVVDRAKWRALCQEALARDDVGFLLGDGRAPPACEQRCRQSRYRAVAACTDAACYLRTNKAHEICTNSCSN